MAQTTSTTQSRKVGGKRRVADSIVTALDSLRRSVRADRAKIESAIVGRGNPKSPFTDRDYERARRDLSLVVRQSFVGRDAPVKLATRKVITEAAGDAGLARELLTERNEFGLTLNQELARARARFERRMRRKMRDAVNAGTSKADLAKDVRDAWLKQADASRVVAWHAARAANLSTLRALVGAGDESIEVVLSAMHSKRDICDDRAGVYPVKRARIPPHHVFCKCWIRRVRL